MSGIPVRAFGTPRKGGDPTPSADDVPGMGNHGQRRLRDIARAYPIHVTVKLPKGGWGPDYERQTAWVKANLPHGDFHRGPVRWDDGVFYFRTPASCAAFFAAFPEIELVDGVSAMRLDVRHPPPPPWGRMGGYPARAGGID